MGSTSWCRDASGCFGDLEVRRRERSERDGRGIGALDTDDSWIRGVLHVDAHRPLARPSREVPGVHAQPENQNSRAMTPRRRRASTLGVELVSLEAIGDSQCEAER
jgi:hypothetical protein